MSLDPQIQGVLDMMREAGFPKIGSVPVEILRAKPPESPFPPADVAEIRDFDIPRPEGGTIPARLYRSGENSDGLIVYYHGGGWTIGELDSVDPTLRVLANSTGCSIVSVDYRLAPENPFPAAVEDAWDALKWASAHRNDLTGSSDPAIIVMGDSAGGNLSAVMALLARDSGEVEIAQQVLIYPSTEGDIDHPGLHAFDPPFLDRDEIAWFFDQYIPAEQRSDPRFAPAKAESHADLPPAVIVVATQDLLAEEARIYAGKLIDSGVDAQLLEYEGTIHGFFALPPMLDIVSRSIADVSACITSMIASRKQAAQA